MTTGELYKTTLKETRLTGSRDAKSLGDEYTAYSRSRLSWIDWLYS